MAITYGGSVNWSGLSLLTGASGLLSLGFGSLLGGSLIASATGAAALLIALVFAGAGQRQRRLRDAKLSSDITVIAQRLIQMERREPVARQETSPRAAAMAAGVAADLETLSRLVTDMAETLNIHDRELQALKDAPPPPAPVVQPEPEAVFQAPAARAAITVASMAGQIQAGAGQPELASREDFARAASAILRRLAPPESRPEARLESWPEARPDLGDARDMARATDDPADALDADRLELQLQPNVTLPQRQTRFYEARPGLRGADGAGLDHAYAMAALDGRGLRSRFEGMVLARVLTIVRHLASRDSAASVSLAISPTTLADGAFLAAALQGLESDAEAARRTLFQVSQTDWLRLTTDHRAALQRLRSSGAAIVLDRVSDFRFDWAALVQDGVSYVRAGADLLLDPGRRFEAVQAINALRNAGIGLVATGIEAENWIPDLLDFDVPFAQGGAISPPRAVRADLLGPVAAPPELAKEPEQASGERASFRDFLRRAG